MDILEKLNLTKFFDDITVSSIVSIEKPNPEILNIACKNLGVKPEDCLYVEDHPLDVLCAKKANMDIAWVCSDNDTMPSNISLEKTLLFSMDLFKLFKSLSDTSSSLIFYYLTLTLSKTFFSYYWLGAVRKFIKLS